jgi:Class II Aldolase and Adducin N-terminal domain
MLVRDTKLGHSLAAAFKPATSTGFIYSKVRSALPTQLGGSASSSDPSEIPDHPVVLMRGHGFTTCAEGLEAVVFQSIYTKEAAKTQLLALQLKASYFGETLEGKVDVEGGGKIKSAKVKPEGEIKYLTDREAGDAWEMNMETMARPWGLWCREVEVQPLYRNDVKSNEEEREEATTRSKF